MHRASMNRVVAKIDDPGVRDLAVAAGVVDDGEIPLWSGESLSELFCPSAFEKVQTPPISCRLALNTLSRRLLPLHH